MIKQYFIQSLNLIRQNRLLSTISIIGTALAIAMIMCIVLIYESKVANYEPEVNRDRTLMVGGITATGKEDSGWNNGGRMSLRVAKECFYSLTTAEAVTAVVPQRVNLASSPGEPEETKCVMSYTDDAFWNVFSFRFLSGKPYNQAEFASGIKNAVVSRSLARTIFGTDQVVGRTLSLSYDDYKICGVVEDVSVLADAAYAQVWVPYTTDPYFESSNSEGLLYGYCCYMLAKNPKDFEEIRAEVQKNVDRMNAKQEKLIFMLRGGPDTKLMEMSRMGSSFNQPQVTKLVGSYVVVILIFLMVPAINLSGITLSRMRKRMQEIGVRRAFGATRGELLWQILSENLVISMMGGALGLLLSYLSVLGMREWLLSTTISGQLGMEIDLSSQMLLRPSVFIYAFLFCLIMNLLSAGIPAWRVSRSKIINALNG